MRLLPTFLVWLVLLVLLLMEFAAAYLPSLRGAPPFIGIFMACVVAMTFMRPGSRGLPPIFAIAGVFWLLVMLGLGGMDSFTRHDISVGRAGRDSRLASRGEHGSPVIPGGG